MSEPAKILADKSGPEEAPPAAFDLWESRLCASTGLNKDELRAIRKGKLTEGLHFIICKKRVCYSPQGAQEVHRLLQVLGNGKNAAASPRGNAEEPEAVKAPVTITMKVFRQGLKNPRVIEAHLPEQDPADPQNRRTVRVRKQGNFIRGMEIPVIELRPGVYELARPCPRWRGKW